MEKLRRVSVTYRLPRITATFLIFALVSACVGARPKIEILSEPAGAEVAKADGTKIGKTPLILENDALNSVLSDRFALLVLKYPGYFEREVMLENHGRDSHLVKLNRMSSEAFSSSILQEYSGELNAMTRELLQIQGQILSGKLQIAQQSLKDFQLKYPNIAASFTLQATIALNQGNRAEARALLLRAKALDPADPVTSRMLTATGGNP